VGVADPSALIGRIRIGLGANEQSGHGDTVPAVSFLLIPGFPLRH